MPHRADSNPGRLTPELSTQATLLSYESPSRETQKPSNIPQSSPHVCKRFLALLLHLLSLSKEAKDVLKSLKMVKMRSDCSRQVQLAGSDFSNELSLQLLYNKEFDWPPCPWFLVGRLNPQNFPGNRSIFVINKPLGSYLSLY